MKNIVYLCIGVYTALLVACTAPAIVVTDNTRPRRQQPDRQPTTPPVQQQPPYYAQENTYQVFYDELDPYGDWVDYPGYGYVWSPNVPDNFQPYSTNGHWVYSDDAWTWVSNYKWGWAAFHYGRWFDDDKYGWLWVPGDEWAPAWVTWGQSGNYYGWAPLGPNVRANDRWTPPSNAWTFVPQQHVNKADINNYAVNKTNNTTIIKNVTVINNNTTRVTNNNTTVINNNSNNTTVNNNKTKNVNNKKVVNNNVTVKGNNNVVYNKGPQILDVEKVTNTKVKQVNISDDDKPEEAKVKNNRLTIYRPNIKAGNQAQKKPAPKKVSPLQQRGKRVQ